MSGRGGDRKRNRGQDEEIQSLEQELAALEQELANKDAQLADRDAQLAALDKAIERSNALFEGRYFALIDDVFKPKVKKIPL